MWIVVIIVIVVIIFGITSKGLTPAERKRHEIEEIGRSSEPYVDISVAELENDYEANHLSAQKKYNRRKLRLTGRLTRIAKSGLFPELSFLYDGYTLVLGNGTSCNFRYYSGRLSNKQLDEEILKLRKGQIITVEGVWMDEPISGYGNMRELHLCEKGVMVRSSVKSRTPYKQAASLLREDSFIFSARTTPNDCLHE